MKTKQDLFIELPGEWEYVEKLGKIELREMKKGIKIEGMVSQDSLFIKIAGEKRSPILFDQIYIGKEYSREGTELIKYIKSKDK